MIGLIFIAVWQEVFDNGDDVKNDTVVEVWKGGKDGWMNTVRAVSSTIDIVSCASLSINASLCPYIKYTVSIYLCIYIAEILGHEKRC